ncbi:MAG: dihydrolipoamide acetyltransferase family protein [Gemmatimonadales bacterium]
MAKIDVIMPQMGESIAEGTLSRWMKKVGDAIKRDEPIFEISTDKVDAEIPAPVAGVLAEILVTEGQTVAVQTVVARIETEAGATIAPAAAAPAAPAAAAAPAAPPAPPASSPAKPAAAPAPTAAPTATAPSRPAVAPARAPDVGGNGASETAEERLRRRSTPLVRKMAAEHNLDLSAIAGGGLAGRVTKNDILSYLEAGPTVETPEAAPARAAAVAAGAPGAPRATPAPMHAPAVEAWPGDRVEPWSRIRKLTAEHMVMSRRVSPHVNTIFEVDYTRIAQLRTRRKKDYADRGVNLTYLAFIAKAVADGLRQHPSVNAAVSGESTVFRRDINLGIAVALDWGLIVPVIKHADELSLLGVARAINDLGERARSKKLSPDDVQRGTFTITNPGGFGSVIGTPIINQPQAAILCVGTIEKQPAVVTVDGTDSLAIRTKGMLSLAFDHRIVDGADADRFMADVKRMLQEFPEAAV